MASGDAGTGSNPLRAQPCAETNALEAGGPCPGSPPPREGGSAGPPCAAHPSWDPTAAGQALPRDTADGTGAGTGSRQELPLSCFQPPSGAGATAESRPQAGWEPEASQHSNLPSGPPEPQERPPRGPGAGRAAGRREAAVRREVGPQGRPRSRSLELGHLSVQSAACPCRHRDPWPLGVSPAMATTGSRNSATFRPQGEKPTVGPQPL